jgi:hypothetical protein
MKPRPAPAFATILLKLFCSGPEHDSVEGDLMEQYHLGRGRFWYWKQVLGVVFLGLYGKAARRPLIHTSRIPVGLLFSALLVTTFLSAVIATLSDFSPIFIGAVLGGVLFGMVKYAQAEKPGRLTQSPAPSIVRIDSSKIPIAGGAGAGILIVVLFGAVLHDLPELRLLAIPGLLGGLVVFAGLRLWRSFHPRDVEKEWLSIRAK